jgi:hypothetical protein
MKRLSVIQLTIVILLTLSFSGCRKTQPVNSSQALLFQFEFVNYAMNYEHKGFMIDNEGNVLSYNNPEAWNFPDRNLNISANQVAENLSLCITTGIKVPAVELRKFAYHIPNIAASRVSALRSAADNAGSAEYICWQYNENNSTYKGSIIRMEGNFTCENMNFYSRRIAEWMKEINNQIISK